MCDVPLPMDPILIDGARSFDQMCKCQRAVLRAYRGLIEGGESEPLAVQAALRVYQYHHPEDGRELASLKVERWIHGQSNRLQ